MKRLIFGDPKSIKIRDDYEQKAALGKLEKIVKCPFCGAKNLGHFEYDKRNERIGWNFDCKKTCHNSFKYTKKYGLDGAKVWTNFEGKFIDLFNQLNLNNKGRKNLINKLTIKI